MIGTGRVIEGDLFGIVDRIKAIDSSYFVVENYKLKRLELHSSAQCGNTLALVLPCRFLSARTVELVLKTRAQNKARLIEEMEKNNALLKQRETQSIIKKTEKEVENAFSNL